MPSMKHQLEDVGYYIYRNKVGDSWLKTLRASVGKAFSEHKRIQENNNSEVTSGGVALHAIVTVPELVDFLGELKNLGILKDIEENYFESKFILNSFSALNNLPDESAFSAEIHRDIRFHSGQCNLMLNCLVMLDDFTEENGATWILPGSHRRKEKPDREEFFKSAIQATGRAGDILVFNSNMFHCSGKNVTDKGRRGLPIVFCKSALKQLLDYPRAFGAREFSPEIKQLLGYESRVPASLDEWYQPKERRFYKPDQD
jgi:ectoine hydroxylase-related dioxygenase (phytanoyl-CoA dioxygenase family)